MTSGILDNRSLTLPDSDYLSGDQPASGPRTAKLGATYSPHELWFCECGKDHAFSPYAAAHWAVELEHVCTCGAARTFENGEVTEHRPAGQDGSTKK